MATPNLLVTHEAGSGSRSIIGAAIGAAARVVYLSDISADGRAAALAEADVVMARDTSKELRWGEASLIRNARLIQFITAGVDYIPLADLPSDLPVACNGGAYAEPM